MSDGFQPRRGGVVATFTALEADLLRALAAQLVELLRNEVAAPTASSDPLEDLLDFSGPTSEPDDPVLARLFPTAYPDDDEAAREFRRFTEGDLRNTKAENAARIIDALEEAGLPPLVDDDELSIDIELATPEAVSWMKSLTDIRLALATRLGVEDDDEDYWDGLPDDDPRGHVHAIYGWVGFLQETLVDAVSDR